MPGFDAIYKQTATVFNRYKKDGKTYWIPTVLEGVHLIIDKASARDNYGGKSADNARLHVRYSDSGNEVYIGELRWYPPNDWNKLGCPCNSVTFNCGKHDDFDFFMEGEYQETTGAIDDDAYGRSGFYNYMNSKYDNVFVITSVSKYNLIPHFEIGAR